MGNNNPGLGKRRLARLAKIVIGLLVFAVIVAAIWIPRLNRFQVDGQIVLAGPQDQVTIVRDEKGMPYIHAAGMRDATFAQGFAAAQDRLFQMQLMRLQAQGRLTELVGQDASELDIRNRTIGMARVARQHAKILDDESREMFQSYVDGINAFLDHCPDDLPIEFGLVRNRARPLGGRGFVKHSVSDVVGHQRESESRDRSSKCWLIGSALIEPMSCSRSTSMPTHWNQIQTCSG